MKKLLFILPLLYYSCNEDILADIEALETANIEQDAQIDSLSTVITTQQEYIDSLNNIQNTYIDSLISESSLNDSLLQVYTDSLNTVQNTYIDSLHNAQQITLTTLANSALSAGFVETQVYSGLIPTSWTDLDLSDVVGKFKSLVILKYKISDSGSSSISTRSNGSDFIYFDQVGSINQVSISLSEEFNNSQGLVLIKTDSLGIIEHIQHYTDSSASSPTVLVSVVFYLN